MRKTAQSARPHRASPSLQLGLKSSHRVAPNPPSPQLPTSASPPQRSQSARGAPSDQYPSVALEAAATNKDAAAAMSSVPPRALASGGLLAAARNQVRAEVPKKADAEGFSAWAGSSDTAPEPPPNPLKKQQSAGGLAARLALAASSMGVGKGIRSIADVAKPAIKAKGGLKSMLTRSPLDIALMEAAKSRSEAKRAMSESEINLNKLYARDHDGMVTARGLLVASNRALTRLMACTEGLESQAAEARAKLLDDASALRDASAQSIAQLTAHREMLVSTLCREIKHIETDSTFSLNMLLARNEKGRMQYARLDENMRDQTTDLARQLDEEKTAHAACQSAAERTEGRLAAEVARLCGVIEDLKAEMARKEQEARDAHSLLARTMSAQLADKQRMIDERDKEIEELRETLEGTSATLTGRLRDLAREKAEREDRLEQEKQDLAERGRRAAMELDQRLAMLKVEKERQERAMSDQLQRTQTESAKQAESLKTKIEKMRKLQELALGGVAGDNGTPRPSSSSKTPSTRGRQLLYYESLKNKGRESSSMSWRGNDVWAHEEMNRQEKQLAKARESPK